VVRDAVSHCWWSLIVHHIGSLAAYPPHCVAHGDALQGTTVATPTTFSIQASDYHGKPRLNGGDEFEVVLKGLDKNDQPIEQKAVVKDNQDGA